MAFSRISVGGYINYLQGDPWGLFPHNPIITIKYILDSKVYYVFILINIFIK